MIAKLFCLISFLLMLPLSHCLAAHEVENVIILGAGPAGLTSAIYTGQAGLSPLVVIGNECDGQLVTVPHIENYPGFPEGINGEDLIELLKVQAIKFGTRFKQSPVTSVDLTHNPFLLVFEDGEQRYCKSLIIALGTF